MYASLDILAADVPSQTTPGVFGFFLSRVFSFICSQSSALFHSVEEVPLGGNRDQS